MSLSSTIYYVTLSDAGRRALFDDDEDRRRFTQVVSDAAAACRLTVHAYCWLPSEARMAAQASAVPLNVFAQRVADQYARHPKGGISVMGPRFDQKCRSVPVEGGHTALPELVRHIHLAPLKAGLTDHLLGYPWCSHPVYMGLAPATWVSTAATLTFFEVSGGDEARALYEEFMSQGLGESRLDRDDVHRGLFR